MALTLETNAPGETEALGSVLARLTPLGSVIALHGDLATGKTCLVRGMAARCARGEAVHSPTFTLVNEYEGTPSLYHLDLYRLEGPEELAELGCEELFDSGGICVVEWAERAEGFLPERRLDITLSHAGGDRRRLVFHNHAVLPPGWEDALAGACSSTPG